MSSRNIWYHCNWYRYIIILDLVAGHHIFKLDFIFDIYKRVQKYIFRFRTDFDIGSIIFKRASGMRLLHNHINSSPIRLGTIVQRNAIRLDNSETPWWVVNMFWHLKWHLQYAFLCIEPVDCTWSNWTEWSNCSNSCGGGTQTKSREIAFSAENGGQDCIGNNIVIQNCNMNISCNDTRGNLMFQIHGVKSFLIFHDISNHEFIDVLQ